MAEIQRFQQPNENRLRQAIAAALTTALANVGQNRIDQVVDNIVHQIEQRGDQAQAVIRQQLYSLARATGQSTSDAWNALRNAIPDWNQARETFRAGLESASNQLAELGTDINGQIEREHSQSLVDFFNQQGHDIVQYNDNHRRPTPADRSNMQEVGTDQALTAAATASSSNTVSSGVSKETPITLAQPSYGFQETHTTILPYTCWLTAALNDTGGANQVAIRMNAIHDLIATTLTAAPGAGVAFPSKGIYGVPASTTSSNQGTYLFPETMVSGVVERPSFRDTWIQLYEYYTVLGCEYKITLLNASSSPGNKSIVGVQFDTYSDTAGTTGNIMPITNLSETFAYKNMQWKILGAQTSSDTQPATDVIYGTYKPGQAKRNISNDGDVKTWTKTDGSLPNLKEFLTINCWRAPLAQQASTTSVMMQLELKYIVQFKDLKTQARYPSTSTAAGQNITINLTNNRADTGSALQTWF
jgi:hypothetical protein